MMGRRRVKPPPLSLMITQSRLAALALLIAVVSASSSSSTSSSPPPPGATTTESGRVLNLLAASRKLEEQQQQQAYGDDDVVNNADFQYDLSQFSLKFDKCQYVKMYDEEIAQDEDSTSPMALKHFVLYRLCPTDSCEDSACDAEGVVYGKYTVPVDSYLQYTVENQQRTIENFCEACEELGCMADDAAAYHADDDQQQCEGDDCVTKCSSCQTGCYLYQNLEDSGYVDASEYIECQRLEVQQQQNEGQEQADEAENDEAEGEGEEQGGGGRRRRAQENDDGQQEIYIGPRCNGGKIVIGVFSDERCWEPLDDLDVETLLGSKLSYHLLNQSYAEGQGGCLSCMEDKDNENERDAQDGDEVNEMCEGIYNAAAKCESETGLELGFVQMNREEGGYENQVENEALACTFINSLIWNSYTETGEINVSAPQDEILRVVTKKQTIALSLLSCFILATLSVMFYFDRKIKQIDLANPLVSKGDAELT